MIEIYRNVLIEITADAFGFHWAAFQENKSILDSSKQGGFDSQKAALDHAQKQIDWYLER